MLEGFRLCDRSRDGLSALGADREAVMNTKRESELFMLAGFGERSCATCKRYDEEAACRELVEWVGVVLAEDCLEYVPEDRTVVSDRMLESWR